MKPPERPLAPLANALRAMNAPVTILEHSDVSEWGRREWTYEVRYRDTDRSVSCATSTIGGAALQSSPAPHQVVDDVLVTLLQQVGFPQELILQAVEVSRRLPESAFQCEMVGGYHDGAILADVALDEYGFPPPKIILLLPVSFELSQLEDGVAEVEVPTATYTRDRLSPERRTWLYRT